MTQVFEGESTTREHAFEELKKRRSKELNKPKQKTGRDASSCRDESVLRDLHAKIAEIKAEMNKDCGRKTMTAKKKDMERYMAYKKKAFARGNRIMRFVPRWGKKKTE